MPNWHILDMPIIGRNSTQVLWGGVTDDCANGPMDKILINLVLGIHLEENIALCE